MREVEDTRKTIENLKLAKNIFNGLIQCRDSFESFHPSSTKTERFDIQKSIFECITRTCDERLYFIEDTLKNSDRYLQHDIQREVERKKRAEQNERIIREKEEKERQAILEIQRKKEEEKRIKDEKAIESAKVIEVAYLKNPFTS